MSGEDGEERQAALRLAGQAYFDRVLNETEKEARLKDKAAMQIAPVASHMPSPGKAKEDAASAEQPKQEAAPPPAPEASAEAEKSHTKTTILAIEVLISQAMVE